MSYIPNVVRFWMDMWCIHILWSWFIRSVVALDSMDSPKSDIRALVGYNFSIMLCVCSCEILDRNIAWSKGSFLI